MNPLIKLALFFLVFNLLGVLLCFAMVTYYGTHL